MKLLAIATEDELSERVGERLVEHVGAPLHVALRLRKGGSGYLRSSLISFGQMAAQYPVLIITDLDRIECAPRLINDWFGKKPRPPGLVFRVAVREIEAWLLADHKGMKHLLGKRAGQLPREPDTLPDPKGTLLAFASRASRDVRADLVVERGVIASQGLGYNARLGDFVRDRWNPEEAAERSPSLRKALERVKELAG